MYLDFWVVTVGASGVREGERMGRVNKKIQIRDWERNIFSLLRV
jgi:hypothetical protein